MAFACADSVAFADEAFETVEVDGVVARMEQQESIEWMIGEDHRKVIYKKTALVVVDAVVDADSVAVEASKMRWTRHKLSSFE